MSRTLALVFLILVPLLGFAQQKPQHSQYMINNFLLNPAIAGIEDYTDIRLSARNQWVGVEGAPSTYYLSAHSRLAKKNIAASPGSVETRTPGFAAEREKRSIHRTERYKPRHGAGLILLHDKLGPFERTEANFSYAYHTPLTENLKAAAGVSAGLTQMKVAGSSLSFVDPNDAAGTDRSTWRPNLSGGLWLYSSRFYAGASAAEVLGNAVAFSGDAGEARIHYFFTGAYKVAASGKLAFIPSVMVKWLRPLPVSVDYNLRALYKNRIWAGVSYRQHDSVVFLAGLTLNHIYELGYAYDTGVSSMGASSHEVVLGVRLYNKRRILSPSNLW
ncbi:PorP/SprF family type IX secretion system membrane protein [Pontibacter russatus]|uniref:PorP/SprF family type IX secretion system membrane protein n=1 Tax=Pontibacter russatus TaxID=2694929 RepID=UPI0013798F8A|nr:type IX secretion system membrane protein PorP/SprF [Pontibacter russatus]